VIPIRDHLPATRTPIVTVILVTACALVWFLVQQAQPDVRRVDVGATAVQLPGDLAFSLEWAAVPCEVVQDEPLDLGEVEDTFAGGDPEACRAEGSETQSSRRAELFPEKVIWLSLVVSMFLHGGLLHLGGNLLYLWIFGNNVEDRLGHAAFVGFYLAGGVVASVAHVAVNVDSTVPLVGASGAIAAVMGAYLVWHPNARIDTVLLLIFISVVQVQAKWLLGFWFLLQFFTSDNSGVAWVAHVAGFTFGVVAGLLVGPGRRRSPRGRFDLPDPYGRA
jgi:membrane associated rhomboid family serine protease